MIFFEKDYIEIKYSREDHILVLKWLAWPVSAEYREGMNTLIDAMKHFKTGKLIFNLTNAGALHPNDQKWSVFDWHDRAVKAGQSHIALIIASDIFIQIAAEDTMKDVTLPTASFDNMEAAIDWLKQLDL